LRCWTAREGGNAVWLAGTDRVGLKRVLCLRDRRELTARALDRLDKSPTVYLGARPYLPIQIVLTLQNSRMPCVKSSRPNPDVLTPPNGSCG
jgi:hypothetical protein